MGSKAAIPIWLPVGRERAQLPQDEGLSGLGLWPPGGPGEAGSAGSASLRLGCSGDTRPASTSRVPGPAGNSRQALGGGGGPAGSSEEQRPARATPGLCTWCRGLGLHRARTRVQRARATVAEVGRPRRAHGWAGVPGGFWTPEAQPPLRLGLFLKRQQGRTLVFLEPLPHRRRPGTESAPGVATCPSGPGPLPGRLLRAPWGL